MVTAPSLWDEHLAFLVPAPCARLSAPRHLPQGTKGQPGRQWAYKQHFLRAAHFWFCGAAIAAPEDVRKRVVRACVPLSSVLRSPAGFGGSRKHKSLGWEGVSCRAYFLHQPSPAWIAHKITFWCLRSFFVSICVFN